MCPFRKSDASKAEPNAEMIAYNSGVAHSQQGQFNQAIQDFSNMIALKQDDPAGYSNGASAYAQWRNTTKRSRITTTQSI
jgi:Flp pilus assembly protein TadD